MKHIVIRVIHIFVLFVPVASACRNNEFMRNSRQTRISVSSRLVSSLVPQWTRPTFFRVSKLITFKVNLARGPIPKLHFLPRNNMSFNVILYQKNCKKTTSRTLENFIEVKKKKSIRQLIIFPIFIIKVNVEYDPFHRKKKENEITAPILTFLETRSLNRIYAGWSSLYSRTIGGYRAASSMTHDLPILRFSFSSST